MASPVCCNTTFRFRIYFSPIFLYITSFMWLSKLISDMIDMFCRHTKPLPRQKWLCPADNYKSLRQKREHAAHISQRGQRQPNRAVGQNA